MNTAAVRSEPWGEGNQAQVQQPQSDPKKDDTMWKQEPHIQAFTLRRWVNDSILVEPGKRRVTFDELTPIQFCLGFVKNINDTLDSLTRKFRRAECYELLKLIETTLWETAKGAYISIMHAIEERELSWHDRASLMQRRMTHMHTVVFSGVQGPNRGAQSQANSQPTEKRLICKFHHTGNYWEGADSHTDPLTGITYTHDNTPKK